MMNRQERIDTACAIGIIAVLLILLGVWVGGVTQPAAAAPSEPVAAATVATGTDVATDSESEPSGILGLTVGELLRDAWGSYESQLGIPEPAIGEQFTTIPHYVASYAGQVPEFPGTYFTVESSNEHGVTHVFNMVASQRA